MANSLRVIHSYEKCQIKNDGYLLYFHVLMETEFGLATQYLNRLDSFGWNLSESQLLVLYGLFSIDISSFRRI